MGRRITPPRWHGAGGGAIGPSRRGTVEEAPRRSSNQELGGGALGNEADSGLQTAGVLLELDVLVVVDGDLMLCPEKAGGGERRHRTLGGHDETLAASGEPAGKTT